MTPGPTDLLATIDALESDDDDELKFPWSDAARWNPAEVARDDYLEYLDDGCVLVCESARPWVVTLYEPPWWAQ